jgi:hypothetical protein
MLSDNFRAGTLLGMCLVTALLVRARAKNSANSSL